jgi:hypothetical protein
MALTVDEIEAKVLNLSEEDRARVFESLLLSFQPRKVGEIVRASDIEQARRELARGEVQRGTVDDLVAELTE